MAVTEWSLPVGLYPTRRAPTQCQYQELRALGVADLVGSLLQAMPAPGGGTSQPAVSDQAGAKPDRQLVTGGRRRVNPITIRSLSLSSPKQQLRSTGTGSRCWTD